MLNDPVNIVATITPNLFASNIVATTLYQTTGGWTSIPMTTNGTTYTTATPFRDSRLGQSSTTWSTALSRGMERKARPTIRGRHE